MQTLGGEAAEYDRMDCADTRASLHCDHGLDAHRHVDHDAIAFFNAARLQTIGELAHACVQIAVVDFGNDAVVCLENDRGLIGLRGQMRIQAVVRNIQFAVFEPLVERRIALIQHSGERLLPL
jgi:hypothetical protein